MSSAIVQFKNIAMNVIINTIKVGEAVWFKAKDIATALDYANTTKAIRDNVDEEDRMRLDQLCSRSQNENENKTIFINESGMYSLILNSKKPEAKAFKRWITAEVLPSIRKTGEYKIINDRDVLVGNQFKILNEADLHNKIIEFIRKQYPHAVIIPGLGELQTTPWARSKAYKAGYKGGQPDILILNNHVEYSGLAIELKSPTGKGVVSQNQTEFLTALANNKYKTIISNDYDEVIIQIIDYFNGVRFLCGYCNNVKGFKTKELLHNHCAMFHKIKE
jgi:prophage antirepressor-like protein